ncbi:DNA repair protein RecN [Halocynthiibacter styelae]|uniref:DNA repair protein RecN n=1 Tax=Halocynthiibacter styelae TaxID=2761955 RepID=A0A8J7LJN2_9RHOB|nr:DNA repair protein RecN [Paenihalocynthiibacter styelae]MBI1492545.1 DNA repair protein RecN [Paenihalocynthiibacter styelae]
MLRTVEIRNMLIIDRLELAFQPGLNVLTGETGAGKSILLDSLGFVLGWRGRAELVRQGADQGEVTAVFDLTSDHPAHAILAEAGLPDEGGELILRRINTRDGRKTAWVNDRRASGEVLRQLSETLLELHGQHDDRGLLNARGHQKLLDLYGGFENGLLAKTRKTWRNLRAADQALEVAKARLAELRDEEDFLRHSVAELDALAPEPGEEGQLDAARRRMQAAEKVRADVARAYGAISGDGAEGLLSDALRWLEEADGPAEGLFGDAITALSRAMNELGEAENLVSRGMDTLEFNPAELEDCEERLFAIRGLARKHAVLPDELAGFADGLRDRLAALTGGEADLADLEVAAKEAREMYEAAAQKLRDARIKAAAKLDKAMAAELAPLKMERAVFRTEVSEADEGPDGIDQVSFTVATNPGAPSGPLNKIASGGELSRFLLALKVCLTGDDAQLTMIFDEIDRGVGGATADAVGRRLKALADGGQVLVVTHSPQVAALGGHHWRVEKHSGNSETISRVVPLDDVERVDEIGRMLSGDTISDAARAAAAELLELAAR